MVISGNLDGFDKYLSLAARVLVRMSQANYGYGIECAINYER